MAAQLTRRNFGKSVAVAGLILAGGARPRTVRAEGAKFRLRYATAFPADHPGVTQIQESSLTFVPKLIAAGAVLLALGGWMLGVVRDYATGLIANLPNYFQT